MFRRVKGSSRYIVLTDEGEPLVIDGETQTVSRRARERAMRPADLKERETRYRDRRTARRGAGIIGSDELAEDRKYWRQRFAEQYGIAHGISSDEAYDRMGRPGSMFNRLWAQCEVEDFSFRPGSAWDELTKYANALGGLGDESERARYLAVIAWYQRLGEARSQAWLEKNSKGQFTYPGLPARAKAEITRIGKGNWRR